MPRTKRVVMDNVSYHITCRASRRAEIFKTKEDFERFLFFLWKYKNRYHTKIYAYCLMPNHVHILLNPIASKFLGKRMHGICLSYATYYNVKYGECGHVWQNRYNSNIIQNDQYLINVVSYIEYNPVKAKICFRAENYPWSSYSERALEYGNKVLDDFDF